MLKRLVLPITMLFVALSLSACMTVVPMELPPEGTTANLESKSKETTRRPSGEVTEIKEKESHIKITVTNTPPRYRRSGPFRGETVLGCNRVSDVYRYLDTGYAAPSTCRYMESTDAQPRSSYRASDGRCYTIMEYGRGFSRYFTAVRGGCRAYRYY